MGSTYTSLHYHIVFSTKERLPLIRAEWRPMLHEYLGGTIRGLNGFPNSIGGVADHVHFLAGLPSTRALADVVREIKKASSIWAQQHNPLFSWQDGYAAFAVSATHQKVVSDYIANQEAHHHKTPFLDELKRLLKKNGIAYDSKFLS